MTHFLLERLNAKDSVTLDDAYTYLKPLVVKYVDEEFPGSAQTPTLFNSLGTVYLRP